MFLGLNGGHDELLRVVGYVGGNRKTPQNRGRYLPIRRNQRHSGLGG